mmetsp:Transcript_9903/g.19657  ORF Transcript_9903/g.19657 Transcript_9903/m.19657 type:complete len:112 (+) Transcript_9903:1588-1923(+)
MIIYCTFVFSLLTFLVGFHAVLLVQGQTTAEKLKQTWKKRYLNIYKRGVWGNLRRICRRQARPSHISPSTLVTYEAVIELKHRPQKSDEYEDVRHAHTNLQTPSEGYSPSR